QNCNEYPFIDCGERVSVNSPASIIFSASIIDCNGQLDAGNLLGYNGYKLNATESSEITINIANSNFSFYLSVGTNCNNYNNIFCDYVNSTNYSKTIDVSNYNEIFIGITYVQDRFGNCEVCNINY